MLATVVILSKTQAKVDNAIASIRHAQREKGTVYDPSQIVVVDDGAELAIAGRGCVRIDGVKPFIFSRSANDGIRFARTYRNGDVVLMNDDAQLLTSHGFDNLEAAAHRSKRIGIVSAMVAGMAAAPDQQYAFGPSLAPRSRRNSELAAAGGGNLVLRVRHHMLAFVCVYIRKDVVDAIGLLDERFVGYGYEDDDYCRRAIDAGFELGVAPGCVVEHGLLHSDYRSVGPGGPDLLAENRRHYFQKWPDSDDWQERYSNRPTSQLDTLDDLLQERN